MLSDNIKNLRKAKGLSQDELAIKLHVVRQTVSKWEKGISVPNSKMLIRIAEELNTSVNVLLDEAVEAEDSSELKMIANKLEIINEQIAGLQDSRRKMWRRIFVIGAVVAGCMILSGLARFLFLQTAMQEMDASISIIGGADGPTAIMVAHQVFKPLPLFIALVLTIVSAIGIYKTRKNN